MRHILFGALPPPYGGVSVYNSTLFEHLRDRGVKVWSLYGDSRKRDSQIRYFNHRRLGVVPALLSEGRAARIVDATHFHLEYPHPILLPLWLAAKRVLRFEWIKMIHDGSVPSRYEGFSRLQRFLFYRAVNDVTEFVVPSDELRDWLANTIAVRQRVTVVPSLLPRLPQNLERELSDEQMNLMTSYLTASKRVCSVGLFIPSYGFDQVARAIEKLRQEREEDIELVLLDGAFVTDEQYKNQVLQGRDWITVLENAPTYRVLRRSHVFVRAFADESYGISRVEALWCGVPVVATTAGETRGMLSYQFGDEAALTELLKTVLLDPPLAEVAEWGRRYDDEAKSNLEAVTRIIFRETNGGQA
jgi:glycosyltransferase involved in cell wall biosynthesis